MATDIEIFTLGRYFMWADAMYNDFYVSLKKFGPLDLARSTNGMRQHMFYSYWLGALFVLAEGWEELELSDPKIDALLACADNLDLLRRYRNGTFHFQKTYDDARFMALLTAGRSCMKWIMDLHDEFDRYFASRGKRDST